MDGARRDIYLGVHDSPESRAEYGRIIAEISVAPAAPKLATDAQRLTIDQLVLAYLKFANQHYLGANGSPTGEVREIKRAVTPLHKLYGHTSAAAFGPKALAVVREEMIQADLCRTVINQRVGRLKRLFKWAASQELVPVMVFEALRTLTGLAKGRTSARERAPVKPVDPAHVDATLPFLGAHPRTLVQFQRLTGSRPGEACALRLTDIDCTGDVWLYRPAQHKTQHRGKDRVIPIGPKARALIEAFTAGRGLTDSDFVFSPAVSRAEWVAHARSKRKSKVQPSQQNRRKKKPKRTPGNCYTVTAYAHAIRKAAERAKVSPWHPNQLRHTFATDVRKAHGVEAAQVLLGHAKADVTQVYAERDLALAAKIAAEMG